MSRPVRITILKSELDEDLAQQYALPSFGVCPFHEAGQVFVSDGEHKPEGLCRYAWTPIEEMVARLSKFGTLLPENAGSKDPGKGVFACVDGLRPVIMLIERDE